MQPAEWRPSFTTARHLGPDRHTEAQAMSSTERKRNFVQRNGLSIVLLSLMLLFIAGQAWTGPHVYNEERLEDGLGTIGLWTYLDTPHFRSALFENWESEFLQMGFYVLFTRSLYQLGSSESKDPDKEEEVDREPDPTRKDAPWPVRRGGWILAI